MVITHVQYMKYVFLFYVPSTDLQTETTQLTCNLTKSIHTLFQWPTP